MQKQQEREIKAPKNQMGQVAKGGNFKPKKFKTT
jgi:hypothetical protein